MDSTTMNTYLDMNFPEIVDLLKTKPAHLKNKSTPKPESYNKKPLSVKELFYGANYKHDDKAAFEEIYQSVTAFREEYSPRSSKPEAASSGGGLSVTCEDSNQLVRSNLLSLKHKAAMVSNPVFYGPQDDVKYLVWPGNCVRLPSTKTSGITWVGVNLAGSAWVATEGGFEPFSENREQLPASSVLSVALAYTTDVEMLRCLMPPQYQAGPFAVVSVAPNEKAPVITFEQHTYAAYAIDSLVNALNFSDPSKNVQQVVVHALEFLLGRQLPSTAVEVAGIGFGKHNWGSFTGILSDFDPVCFN